MRTPNLILICIVFYVSGCTNKQEIEALQKDLAKARGTIESHGIKIRLLEQSIGDLRRSIQIDRDIDAFEKSAYLTPASSGHATIRFSLGTLTVSIPSVEPYANGTRVNLRFGNPLLATITECEATVEYGPVDDKNKPKEDKIRSKKITISRSLHSGAWTTVPVVLEGIPTEELGFVRIKELQYSSISFPGR